MWLRKIIGFVIGFLAAFSLLAVFSSGTGFVPRGAGWIFLMIGCGIIAAKIACNPNFYGQLVKTTAQIKTEGVRNYWWGIQSKTRILLLANGAWILLSYFIQDSYERNLRIVFLPAIVVVGLYLAINYFGKDKQ